MNFTQIRIAVATLSYGLIALFTIVLMIFGRSPETSRIPKFIEGSLPNFSVTALAPILLIFSQRKYTPTLYSHFILAVLFALIFYEFIQPWMLRRTFDWDDILASIVGALIALLAGRLIPFPFLIRAQK